MENDLLKNDKTISNNQNDVVNDNTKLKVYGIEQNLNVNFFVRISRHAQKRYDERQIDWVASWRKLLVDSDFGEQVFNAILTKKVKVMEGVKDENINSDDCYNDNSFIYYYRNDKCSISIPLLWTNYIINKNGSIKVDILIKTVFWKDNPYRFNVTQKGQHVFKSVRDTFGYSIEKNDKAVYQFNTIIPIKFKVKNAMAPIYNDVAEQCISYLQWDPPVRVAAGCIRRTLNYFINMWLSDKLELQDMFTLIEDRDKNRPPLYVGIMFNGFNEKSPMFFFALRKMSFKNFSYGENKDMNVTSDNDNLVRDIIAKGSKVQDGLKRYAYISETHLKQIIKESLLKYLNYIL